MSKRILILIIAILSFHSCKKTKLEGELSVLVGKWKWKHTLITKDLCDPSVITPYVIYDPSIVGFNYEMEFLKKGKLIIKKSGEKDRKYRLIRHDFETAFYFTLNKEKGKGFTVYYYKSSGKEYLNSNNLPLDLVNGSDGCKGIMSIFEKVE